MPAQVLILLARTLRKLKTAASLPLRKRWIDGDESARGRATTRGLHSVALHTRRNDGRAMFFAPRGRSQAVQERRSPLLNSYTTTFPDTPRWSCIGGPRSQDRGRRGDRRGAADRTPCAG